MMLNRLFAALFAFTLVIPPGMCGQACAGVAVVDEVAVPACCQQHSSSKSDSSPDLPHSIPPRCCCVHDGLVLKKVTPPSDQALALMPVAIVDVFGTLSPTVPAAFVPVVDPPRLRLHLLQCVWLC